MSRTGERDKFRFDSLRDPHLCYILGTGFRSSVQDARVTVTVCCEFSLKISVPKQSLFFLVPDLKSYGAEPIFSPMHTLIFTHMYVLFPMLLFFGKCKDLKASLGKAGDITQLEEGLPHMQEVLGSIPTP